MGPLAGDGARLAAFAVETRSFPPEAIEQATRMMVDGIACQVAFASLPWSRAYRDAIASLGSGDGATVVYYGDRLSIDAAAFLNSAFMHANEFDDTHLGSGTHPGSIVLTPSLALAEQRRRSGRQVLEAMIVGTEVTVDASAPHLHDNAFPAPTACGPSPGRRPQPAHRRDAATCPRVRHAGKQAAVWHPATGGSVKRILGAIRRRRTALGGHGGTRDHGPRTIPVSGFSAFVSRSIGCRKRIG